MIYYRSPDTSRMSGMSLHQARRATAVALLAYPIGGIVRLAVTGANASSVGSLVGFGLMVVAVLTAATVLGSRFQRIIAEQADRLDEWEIALRSRSLGHAYGAFTALMLAGIAYCGVAGSIGGWLPSTFEEYGAIFWGIFLYAVILPTAILVWQLDARDDVAAGGDR